MFDFSGCASLLLVVLRGYGPTRVLGDMRGTEAGYGGTVGAGRGATAAPYEDLPPPPGTESARRNQWH
eukprot:1066491-Rhodomonas_salina.2